MSSSCGNCVGYDFVNGADLGMDRFVALLGAPILYGMLLRFRKLRRGRMH